MNLDNLEEAKRIDRKDVLGSIGRYPEAGEETLKTVKDFKISFKPKNVVIFGMGGSAAGGHILKDWLNDLNIQIFREYDLPGYFDKNTLFIASSYSGGTEEPINAAKQAVERGCCVIGIGSGGELGSYCKENSIPFIKVPAGFPPRYAVMHMFYPLVFVLQKTGWINKQEEVDESIEILKQLRDALKPEIKTENNPAKKIALRIKDTIPVVCGFEQYNSIALRAKAEFNENAKINAFVDCFPELNHTSLLAWDKDQTLNKYLSVILIRDDYEPKQIRKRIEFTKQVMEKTAKNVIEIHSVGRSKLARMLSLMYIFEYISVYLAILYERDPSPYDLLLKLKEYLRK